jgi:hypothetical protein
MLQKGGLSKEDVERVEAVKLKGLQDAECWLEHRITLMWHLNRHMNSQVNEFYVVDNNQIDTITLPHMLTSSRSMGDRVADTEQVDVITLPHILPHTTKQPKHGR